MSKTDSKKMHENDFMRVYLWELSDIKKRKEEVKKAKEKELSEMKPGEKDSSEIEKIKQDIKALSEEINTIASIAASVAQCHLSWFEKLKSQKKQTIDNKHKELKALESKRQGSRKSERLHDEIDTLESEIAWLEKVDLPPKPVQPITTPSTKTDLIGLSLSGGGIRSATFNLGLLQALCNNNMLEKIDYLSTVSGGGYIGSCMTALLNSEPKFVGLTKKTFPLGTEVTENKSPPGKEKEPVRRLRYFSNYLTAEGGFRDKYFRPAMVVLRGLVLNFSLLIPFLIAFILLMSIAFNLKFIIPFIPFDRVVFDIQEFRKILEDDTAAHRRAQAELKSFLLKETADLGIENESARIKLAKDSFNSTKKIDELENKEKAYAVLKKKTDEAKKMLKHEWWAIWIVPAVFIILLVLTALFRRSKYNDEFYIRLKFSNRLTLLLVCAITTLFIQLYGVLIVYWETWDITSWIASVSLFSLFAPRLLQSADANKAQGKKPVIKLVIALGLLALVPIVLLFLAGIGISYATDPDYAIKAIPLLIFCLLIFLIVNGKCINLNEISLHNFYRDRLSRAYLFKYKPDSRPKTPHCDGIKLSKLKPESGPYHLFNTVLNLKRKVPTDSPGDKNNPGNSTSDKEIFRNGESFVFNQNWCGSEKSGYCPTLIYEQADPHIDVGTAVAISGAAANIGMAHKNIPALRLLMGLLNIRLGYWALHPKIAATRKKPPFWQKFPGSIQAFREWFGSYKLDYRYINLSDGGHFDNIGVYELLRRRCKYIIVGDAEADPEMKFEAISYILRLARIDFGIEIDIDTTDMKLGHANSFSRNHCVVGRINYSEKEFGYLLYCKASLSGDEPEHLYEYKVKHPQFPHQTTADQWFDEQQFEAYRELGYHVGKAAFAPIVETDISDKEEMFNTLKEFWHPHSEAIETHFTRHTVELNKIVSEIKNDKDLSFMDAQMYPEWDHLIAPPTGKQLPDEQKPYSYFWLPSKDKEIRKGFYLCNLMMQLMENVYTDLNLENEHDHPDNRGWMNLFRHWSWSGMFRVSWAISACTFGARFQKFCEKYLHLNLGELSLDTSTNIDKTVANELNPYEQRVMLHCQDYKNIHFDAIWIFKLKVQDPIDPDNEKTFHFGFALVKAKKQLTFFRVQDHLRQMGLGRKVLMKFIDRGIDSYSDELIKILKAKEDDDTIRIEEQDLVRFDRMCKQAGLSKTP